MKTFAIARTDRPTDILIWCSPLGESKNGKRRFHVINGNWDGAISADGSVSIPRRLGETPGYKIVWEGEVPSEFAARGQFAPDYNGAMDWIKQQVTNRFDNPSADE